jgi:uncharacterized integral membrane protein
MQLLLLDALYAAGLGQLLIALAEYFLGAIVLGFLLYCWVQYSKVQKKQQLASRIRWTQEETQAHRARKKGRLRVLVAVIVVFALLASYPW